MKKPIAAKIDENPYLVVDDLVVSINGYKYVSSGCHLSEALYIALEEHSEKERSFTDTIVIESMVDGDEGKVSIYAPALLCGFGFMSVQELSTMLFKRVLGDEKKDNTSTKEVTCAN